MSSIIQFKRGSAHPPALLPGEPGWCINTKELYIGTDGTVDGNELVGSCGTCPNYDQAIALIEDRLDALEADASPFALSATVEDLAGDIWSLYDEHGGNLSYVSGYIKISYAASVTIGGKLLAANDSVLISQPRPPISSTGYRYCGLWVYKGVVGGMLDFRREADWFSLNDSVPSRTLVIVREGSHKGRISVITSNTDPFVVGSNQIYVNSMIKSSTGGNIYIQATAPVAPQENDVWFDLNLVME